MKNRVEVASSKFLEGYNCAQSVFYAFCDDLHIDRNLALKLACGFGAGMGRSQEVCGAVTGGIMVIGAKFGRGEKDDRKATELTYRKTRELMERFGKKHGVVICRQLVDECDFSTEQGQKEFKEKDLIHKTCLPCVESVVEILDDIIFLFP